MPIVEIPGEIGSGRDEEHMAVNEAAVRAAVEAVVEPTLRRPLGELGMVRDISAGRRNRVSVLIAVPDRHWPQHEELRSAVGEAAERVTGAGSVEVPFTLMEEDDLDALHGLLKGETEGETHPNAGQAGHGHAAGPTKAAPFMRPGSRTRVLGISSGKGGVGKSSVTVNLAVTLAAQGRHVAVLDADVYGFSVPKMLGITEDPVALDRDLMIPPVAHGVACISMDYFVPEDKALIWRGPMLHKALEEFLTNVYWGEPDFLLLDMPPGTGDVALSMAQYLPKAEVYVVTTPQAAAQRVAKKTAQMARDPKVNLPVMGVIENMSWFTGDDGKRYELFGAGGGQALADELGVPLLGQIPLVPELREGGDVGSPEVLRQPGGEAAAAFTALAKSIEGIGPRRVFKPELRIT